jgi:hypothetical protein
MLEHRSAPSSPVLSDVAGIGAQLLVLDGQTRAAEDLLDSLAMSALPVATLRALGAINV